jgi:hypothetical protein
MENLVAPVICKPHRFSSNDARIWIFGHKGYLGSHLFQDFVRLGYQVSEIDLRVTNTKTIEIAPNDLVIDCSRIRNFDPPSLIEDQKLFLDVFEGISLSNTSYIRIGSTLELEEGVRPSPYVKWSRGRTQLISETLKTRNSSVVLVPNVFGGSDSPSVVDRLLSAALAGEDFHLENPGDTRDFLAMDVFLASIQDHISSNLNSSSNTFVITCGKKYEVGSIKKYIQSQSVIDLKSQSAEYPKMFKITIGSDALPEYLKRY